MCHWQSGAPHTPHYTFQGNPLYTEYTLCTQGPGTPADVSAGGQNARLTPYQDTSPRDLHTSVITELQQRTQGYHTSQTQ